MSSVEVAALDELAVGDDELDELDSVIDVAAADAARSLYSIAAASVTQSAKASRAVASLILKVDKTFMINLHFMVNYFQILIAP